jgi:two-component system, chemotaxis family, chemotaxis protein CheV
MTKTQSGRGGSGTGILLEVGTNELEVLRFTLAGQPFGINVAKLREIIPPPEIRKMEQYHPAFEGVFLLRDKTIPIFGLRAFLGYPSQTADELTKPRSSLVLITEFNRAVSAYRVDGVDRIWRVTSRQIEPPPRVRGSEKAPVTAMLTIQGQPMPMLDFESVYNAITGTSMTMPTKQAPAGLQRGQHKVVIVEDSPSIREMITKAMEGSGYPLRVFEDGGQAWEWLKKVGERGESVVKESVDVVITDIEMPQMDGLQLCRQIREHAALQSVRVVLFSSLVTDANRLKGETVGASAQLAKPQLDQVVQVLDDLFLKAPA